MHQKLMNIKGLRFLYTYNILISISEGSLVTSYIQCSSIWISNKNPFVSKVLQYLIKTWFKCIYIIQNHNCYVHHTCYLVSSHKSHVFTHSPTLDAETWRSICEGCNSSLTLEEGLLWWKWWGNVLQKSLAILDSNNVHRVMAVFQEKNSFQSEAKVNLNVDNCFLRRS